MNDLASQKCIPCRGNVPPLTESEIAELRPQVPKWEVVAHTCPGGRCQGDSILRLQRAFKFKNFADAMTFANKVAEIAEREDHHPRIVTEWGKVTVQWWTHVIHGLHRNDFIMAAKTDELFS